MFDLFTNGHKMIVLDTSALIRYFTNDDPAKARKVKELLKSGKKVFLPDVVFPELEYVLSDSYGASRGKLAESFQFLLSHPGIKTNPKVQDALEIFVRTKLDFADCLVVSHALEKQLASFDREMLRTTGVTPYWE